MDNLIMNEIKTNKILAALADEKGEVVWKSSESPVASLYKAYFKGSFQNKEGLTLYASQAGLAMAIIAKMMGIKACHAFRVSECGLEKFRENGTAVDYEERIPLVKSSKNDNVVCPIELFLSQHSDAEEQWDFLEDRFHRDMDAPLSCSIEAHRKKM